MPNMPMPPPRSGTTMKFWTENSAYEINPGSRLIRRLSSTHEPTANQSEGTDADGWRHYEQLGPYGAHLAQRAGDPLAWTQSPIEVGDRVLIVWGVTLPRPGEIKYLPGEPVLRRTLTSVVKVIERD